MTLDIISFCWYLLDYPKSMCYFKVFLQLISACRLRHLSLLFVWINKISLSLSPLKFAWLRLCLNFRSYNDSDIPVVPGIFTFSAMLTALKVYQRFALILLNAFVSINRVFAVFIPLQYAKVFKITNTITMLVLVFQLCLPIFIVYAFQLCEWKNLLQLALLKFSLCTAGSPRNSRKCYYQNEAF